MPTCSHERGPVIWPDVVVAGLQVQLGAVMVGYGLVVPKGIGAHVAVVGVALVVLLIGLAALRFGAGATVAVLLSAGSLFVWDPVPFFVAYSKEDFPSLVYGFPFLSTGAACFALGFVLMATKGDERLGVSFFMAGTGLVVLSLLVPPIRGMVRAARGSSGDGK